MRVRTAGYGIFQQKRSGRPFIFKVNYASGFTLTLPITTGDSYWTPGQTFNHNFIVDWGDGNVSQVTSATDPDRIHTYASGGTYTVTITGVMECFHSGVTGADVSPYLIEISQWGRTGLKYVYLWQCSRLTACYGKLDTSPFHYFSRMFSYCTNLEYVDVSDWDVSNVINFGNNWKSGCFEGCTKLTSLDVSNWQFSTSSNVNLGQCFYGCTGLTALDVSNWNTDWVTTLTNTFNSCSKVPVLDVSNWNVSKVTGFSGAFGNCSSVTSFDVSGWVIKTTVGANINMSSMFAGCSKITTIGNVSASGSSWDTTEVTNMASMFVNCAAITTEAVSFPGISDWNVSKVTNFGSMFSGCGNLTNIDLSGWRFSTTATSVDLSEMFRYDGKLVSYGDVSGWTMNKVSAMNYMNDGCIVLVGDPVVGYDVSGWTFTVLTGLTATFWHCRALAALDVSGWDTSKVIGMAGLFGDCQTITTLDVSAWDVSKVTSFAVPYGAHACFGGMLSLTSLDLSAWQFNTTANVNVSNMFAGDVLLTTIGDTSGWNTSKFSNCTGMFYGCVLLDVGSATGFDPSGWTISNCTNVASMFQGCTGLTNIDINAWDVSKVTTTASMFQGCTGLTSLDLSNWNLSSAITLNGMFSGCTGLTSLDVTGWTLNTTASVGMSGLFAFCTSLTSLSFTGWNTSKVTNFQQLLDGCTGLTTCDVSVLNTAAATNVSYMFRNCRSMSSIDISGWDLSLVTAANMTQYMFSGCYGLTSLTLPASLSRVDNQFAVFTETPAITVYNIYRATAPTVSGTPFGNYAKPLHVPVGATGYDVAPWTTAAIFTQPINYDL